MTRLGLLACAVVLAGCPRHVSGIAMRPAGACTWKIDSFEGACVAADRTGAEEWDARRIPCGSEAYLCGERRACHCGGERFSCPKAEGVSVMLTSPTCMLILHPPENGMCPLYGGTHTDKEFPDGLGALAFGFVETDMCGHPFSCSCKSFSIPETACNASISRFGDHCVLTQRLDAYEYRREVANGATVTVCSKSYTCTL
jgi:hypothetical protein